VLRQLTDTKANRFINISSNIVPNDGSLEQPRSNQLPDPQPHPSFPPVRIWWNLVGYVALAGAGSVAAVQLIFEGLLPRLGVISSRVTRGASYALVGALILVTSCGVFFASSDPLRSANF
jgi:hypothetical protein